MPRPTPRLAPVTTATRPRRSGGCQLMAAPAGPRSAVQRGLLLRGRERPRRLRQARARRKRQRTCCGGRSPVGMVGPERRARLVEIERTEEVALEVAVLARNLLCGQPEPSPCAARPPRHNPSPTGTGRIQPPPPTACNAGTRTPQTFSDFVRSAANDGIHALRPGRCRIFRTFWASPMRAALLLR